MIMCSPKLLDPKLYLTAASRAIRINPNNSPRREPPGGVAAAPLTPENLAVLTSRYWGPAGVRLSVSFMDSPTTTLQAKILAHMNAWGQYANVQFSATASGGQVRIARTSGDGYWSYLGTDILSIPTNEPTLNLDSFTDATEESEFYRVVRHETGHTLGFPHEHLRAAIVGRINRAKAIAYFEQTQGWSEAVVVQQVLTPLDETTLMANAADVLSIMAYQLPAAIMSDSVEVPGGADINASDAELVGKLYPLPGMVDSLTVKIPQAGTYKLVKQ